ncbi:hypothetical protein CC80DRAFT_491187 [Byssothecium circinans]|uniref:Rhodopsin domain-containing protein n=1 Tax=Byssothecium circinans TaxID=147558 RepID=A0A6A5TYX0_9PLEO|nr:hypothetical protein CC80DRAFT_491187 [Byssothecium circinans]
MTQATDPSAALPPQMPPLEAMFPAEYIAANRGPLAERVAYVFMFLELLVVALRFISRRQIKARLGLDDYLVFPGLLFCLGMCILTIIMTRVTGMGKHMPIVAITNMDGIISWAKAGYAIEILHSLAVVFPRLSILASYMRIFITKPYKLAAYALAFVIIATSFAGIIVSVAQCRPFSARWSGEAAMAKYCINSMSYFRWLVFVNMITDVVMLILPIPIIWNIQLGVRERIALILVFALGSVGLITSTIRFTIFFKVKELSTDGTWLSTDLAIWSTIEPGMYLIASCLPPLRPLFLKFLNIARDKTYRSGNASKGTKMSSGGITKNNTVEIVMERRSKRQSDISDEERMIQI